MDQARQKAVAVLLIVLIIAVPQLAEAQPRLTKAIQLKAACEHVEHLRKPTSDVAGSNYCLGFVLGVTQGMKLREFLIDGRPSEKPLLCVPDGATAEQLSLVVLKFLRANPERLHEDALTLTAWALFDAFPCPR